MPQVVRRVGRLLFFCGLLPAAAGAAPAAAPPGPESVFEQTIAEAENNLRDGEVQTAESRYRDGLLQGWLVVGTLERLDGRVTSARDAFQTASRSAVDNRVALRALGLTHLQLGDAAQAVAVLAPLAERDADPQNRRLLAQALLADGETARAVAELLAAHAAAPEDRELTFELARVYLSQQKEDLAARLFAQIVAARPIPQTHLLIARMYSDLGRYDPARDELRTALKLDPRVRHAHYYLGLIELKEKGRSGFDEAIAEFQAELTLAPEDPLANRELGVALVDVQRPEEALPALEIAARAEPVPPRVLYYLGRAQLARDQAAPAVASLTRALEGVEGQGAANRQVLRTIHLQLADALRRLGKTEESARHFAEAQRTSEEGTDAARDQLARYLADAPETEHANAPAVPTIEASPLAALPDAARRVIETRIKAALARAYLNLGLMKAQVERSAQAATLLEQAAALDPDFPQVQSSLGIAYFNARQFDKATGALARALLAGPADPALKRLLAMAWLNTQAYDKAAALLQDDPERLRNPSLQFAYGLALVKSGRAAEAEPIFARMLAQNGDSPELSVLLGQAHAQEGDFDSAIREFERALRSKADVAEANGALGVIYWKQGKLAEAEAALRAELKIRPSDTQSQQNLAVVLESLQRPEEALTLLRSALAAKPDFADARYLLGKILLARGAAEEAAENLEAAARLAPGDANVHYQLGRAYQKLGRAELAEKELDLYRQIKDKRREPLS